MRHLIIQICLVPREHINETQNSASIEEMYANVQSIDELILNMLKKLLFYNKNY